jgi:hypothetical protein
MALFTASPIISELRKKAGTNVFSKNHYGPFIRKRVKGINPRSIPQQTIRASLTSFAKGWKSLTAPQLLAWNAYAKVYYISNRLGQKITLTGENWYIKLAIINTEIGVAVVATPPGLTVTAPVLLLALTATIVAATSITLACTTAPVATNFARIYASAPLSLGKSYNSQLRFLGLWKLADTNTKVITTLYTAVYGAVPPANSKIFFAVQSTDSTTGISNFRQKFSGTC